MDADSGATLDVAVDLWRFAKALGGVGRAEEAAQLASLSDALRDELGSRVPWIQREADKTIAEVRAQLDPVVFREAWERGKRLTIERAVEMALGRAPARRTVQSMSAS
jgi:hypothetical protein